MIIGYFGFNGSGKTLALSKALTGYDTVFANYGYQAQKGQKVCELPDCEALFDILKQYTELVGVGSEKVALAIDEAGLNFPARSWKNISKREAYLFAQHRKLGIDLLYTAQNVKMVDSILRNNTALSSYPRHFFTLFYEAWYEGCEKARDGFMYRTLWNGARYYGLYDTLEVVASTKFYEDGVTVTIKDWGEVFHVPTVRDNGVHNGALVAGAVCTGAVESEDKKE
jgi:hypothetical protein